MNTETHSGHLLGDAEAGAANQYLTFMVGDEEFGVDILRVQEIKGWERETSIPNTPNYIRGVMNLRGTVVPIIDLRLRFRLDRADYTATTVVIVLRVEGDQSERTMGFVVDAVSEVYNVTADNLQPAPDFGDRVNTEYIRGLAVVEDQTIILLDFDRLVGLDTAFATIDRFETTAAHPADGNPTVDNVANTAANNAAAPVGSPQERSF